MVLERLLLLLRRWPLLPGHGRESPTFFGTCRFAERGSGGAWAAVPRWGEAHCSHDCSCPLGQRFWVYQEAKVLGPRSTEKLGIGRDVPKVVGALQRKHGKVLLFSGEQFWRYWQPAVGKETTWGESASPPDLPVTFLVTAGHKKQARGLGSGRDLMLVTQAAAAKGSGAVPSGTGPGSQ